MDERTHRHTAKIMRAWDTQGLDKLTRIAGLECKELAWMRMTMAGMDEDDNQLERGMGRVLDISQTGLLLETHHLIQSEKILMSASGVQEGLIDIKGKVVYSKNSGFETYHTGVEFYENDSQAHRFVVELIKAFNLQKSH